MPLINDLIPCGKGGIELDGFIREYMVGDNSIKKGDFVELDIPEGILSNGMVFNYDDTYTQVKSGNIHTVGTNAADKNIDFLRVSDDKMLVFYSNDRNQEVDGVYVAVATITDDVVSMGAFTQIATACYYVTAVERISDDKVLLIINGLGYSIATISGSTVTVNTFTTHSISNNRADTLAIVRLSENKFVIACIANSNTASYYYLRTLTISGNSVSLGTPVQLETVGLGGDGRFGYSLETISDTSVILTYVTKATSSATTTAFTKTFLINGTTITVSQSSTLGSTTFSSSTTGTIAGTTKIIKINNNEFYVFFRSEVGGTGGELNYYISVDSSNKFSYSSVPLDLSNSGLILPSGNLLLAEDTKVSIYDINNRTSPALINSLVTSTSSTTTNLYHVIKDIYLVTPCGCLMSITDGAINLLANDVGDGQLLNADADTFVLWVKYTGLGGSISYKVIDIDHAKIIPYNSTILGIANKDGLTNDIIEVWQPYYTYKKYTVSYNTTTTTGYVESKSSSTSSISFGYMWSTTYIAYADSINVDFDTGTITLNDPSQVISNNLGNDATVLNNKYFMTSTSGYVTSGTQAYLGDGTNATTGWNNSKVAYTITTKQSTITTTTENKGDFIEEFKAEDRIYPDNGKHTDGYWYILNGF